MKEYKSLRVEKPVYASLATLQLPRETYSKLIERLVISYNTMKADVSLVVSPLKGERKEGELNGTTEG